MTFTFWYAPRPAWSISGGYGFYSNWIDQDIYFPSDTPDVEPLDRQQWNYGGRGQILSLGRQLCVDRAIDVLRVAPVGLGFGCV